MSALGVKRSWDSFASRPDPLQTIRPSACSPHRIHFLSNEEKHAHTPNTHSHHASSSSSSLPPFHPSSSSSSSPSPSSSSWDPHTNSGSFGSKRFRRTEGGDYDIVTVSGEDVHMDTKSPTHDAADSPRSPTTSPGTSTSTGSSTSTTATTSHSYRSSREPSVFVQAAQAASQQPFVNLDHMLQSAANTRTKRQRPHDDDDAPTSTRKKLLTSHDRTQSLTDARESTSTPTSKSNTSTSSTPTSTPGVSSLGVFSHSHSASTSSRPSAAASSSSTTSSSQPLFTLTQVRKIVEQALAQQKEQLTQEYDNILNDKLREQFENFSSFNRDYISRQLSKNDFSYLS